MVLTENEINESTYSAEVLCASWNPTLEAIAEYIQDNHALEIVDTAEPMDEAAFLTRIYAYQE